MSGPKERAKMSRQEKDQMRAARIHSKRHWKIPMACSCGNRVIIDVQVEAGNTMAPIPEYHCTICPMLPKMQVAPAQEVEPNLIERVVQNGPMPPMPTPR